MTQHIQNSAIDHMSILRYNRFWFYHILFFMQKLLSKSMVNLYKSCSSSDREPDKIEFVFF
jgi:hypothetical protein